MEEIQKPKKNISDIVRKLLNSNDVPVKTAALYLNCTEQSFRNKLSRDSFSLKDLIILLYKLEWSHRDLHWNLEVPNTL